MNQVATIAALVAACLTLTACGTETSQGRGSHSTSSEGVQMQIDAALDSARVTTIERGSNVGEYRRAFLAEVETALFTRCKSVRLIEQQSGTQNDTTTATLTYALADCPPAMAR